MSVSIRLKSVGKGPAGATDPPKVAALVKDLDRAFGTFQRSLWSLRHNVETISQTVQQVCANRMSDQVAAPDED